MANITMEVIKRVGTINTRKNNSLELRIVSWNGNAPKYDIRGWYVDSDGNERCTKGISVTAKELSSIYETIKDVDFTKESKHRVYGTIPQTAGYEIVVQLTKYGFDIRSFKGNYGVKGISMTASEMMEFVRILASELGGDSADEPKNAPKQMSTTTPAATPKLAELKEKYSPKSDDEKIIHSLTNIPVNDGSYPLNKATVEQLREAISLMEAKPNGNKTRLTRCKAKLKQLEKKSTAEVVATETVATTETSTDEATTEVVDTEVVATKATTTEEVKSEPSASSASIIVFPKKDTTTITKLTPTGENHEFAEAEAKLNAERESFRGDRDSNYVIDGILELCKADQEFLDNVMRPEKSYVGAFQYFANKARQGYCMKVGNVSVMDADTALRYAIDYFNSDEQKKESPKANPAKVTPIATTRKSTGKNNGKKSAPKRKYVRRITRR